MHTKPWLAVIGASILATFTIVAPADAVGSPRVWYTAESTMSASTSIRGDSDGAILTDKTYCYVYGLGDKHINVGGTPGTQDFTGVADTSPIGLGQRGLWEVSPYSHPWYGSTACQVRVNGTDRWMGFQVHKDSITDGNTINATGWIYGAQMNRNWGGDLSRRPWAAEFGADPRLAVSALYSVQDRRAEANTYQYGQFTLSLVDTTTAEGSPYRSVWLTVSIWDSRNTHGESVHLDSGGTSNYIIDTYLASGLNYVGVGTGSQNFAGTSSCGCLYYAATISRANLIAAITEVNRKMAIETPGRPAYSLDPSNWAVNQVSVGTEMYSPPGTTGWIGSRAANLTLTTIP
jgi:hypothetical protein